jgi:hypothetical protein
MYILSNKFPLPFLFSRAELTKGIVYVGYSSSARTLKKSYIKIEIADFSKTLKRVYPREEKNIGLTRQSKKSMNIKSDLLMDSGAFYYVKCCAQRESERSTTSRICTSHFRGVVDLCRETIRLWCVQQVSLLWYTYVLSQVNRFNQFR